MASYHCSVKTGGKGRAGKHSDYISREGKYAPELTKGTSKLEDLEHKASGNMPVWAAHDAGVFWKAADEHERANGATYREIEVALPRELTPEQRRELVEDFIQKQIGDRHSFTYAIHIPKAAIEKGEQPHAHIMYSERTLDGIARDPDQFFKRANTKNPEKGGCKKNSAGTQERLLATRELWAEVQNQHLEKAGFDERVSHLSLKAQGIDRQPEKHLGPVDARKVNASALLEHRAAERELDQVRREPAIDVAAELAAQAQAAEAARQVIQAAQETAARQVAQAQAQREAAALVAREAALNAQLTAEKEREDDRVRAAALAALTKSRGAAGRAIAFAFTDHGGIADHLDAAGGDLGRAGEGAKRRVARSHLESSASAIGEQLGQARHLLQQLVRYLPRVVETIAAAAKAVTHQLQKIPATAPERPTAGAPTQARGIPAPAPEKPPTVVLEPALTDVDRKLITRLDDAIERAAKGDQKAMDSLPDLLDKLDDAQRDAASAYSRAKPPQFDWIEAGREAQRARDVEAKLQVNGQAATRGVGAVPYPPGLSAHWAAEHHSSYETALKKAVAEFGYHAREPRPEGFWKKKETAAYDAKTAELQSKVAGWQKEIKWRDGALDAVNEALAPRDKDHVAALKAEHDRQQAQTEEKAAPLRARSEAHTRENSRLQEKIERLFNPAKRQELDDLKETDRGLGR